VRPGVGDYEVVALLSDALRQAGFFAASGFSAPFDSAAVVDGYVDDVGLAW